MQENRGHGNRARRRNRGGLLQDGVERTVVLENNKPLVTLNERHAAEERKNNRQRTLYTKRTGLDSMDIDNNATATTGTETEKRFKRGGRGGRGGFRNFRGRGGGRGRGNRRQQREPISQDQLDAELDSYMMGNTETAKSKLDEDLDSYMNEAAKANEMVTEEK